ncbi:hypothetical protein [Paracnuella aquatica]|uniref:hypothetical protein n=1 Tax=Paracnuella aquatica TaxID=2268757 RepID=UPI000DEF48FB|nr:hypothetical protein [Paracnuella aquatica]RPD49182.1 hypothetical protein DRJ53_08695 [Paracnuella aquatica]
MEHTVVVLFKNALAHYHVVQSGALGYEASLLRYGGSAENVPPIDVRFVKEGRHCTGSTEEADLMDDLYDAVQRKEQKREGPAGAHPPVVQPYLTL